MPPRAPGAARGSVPVVRQSPQAPLELEDELEGALVDAVGGEPPGPQLGKRLERVAREILLRRGLGSAKVEVHVTRKETHVQIWLSPGVPLVRTLKLDIAGR